MEFYFDVMKSCSISWLIYHTFTLNIAYSVFVYGREFCMDKLQCLDDMKSDSNQYFILCTNFPPPNPCEELFIECICGNQLSSTTSEIVSQLNMNT